MPERTRLAAAAALALALASPSTRAEPAPGYAGRWTTASGNLEVDIARCGDAWCGTVARVLANRSMSAAGQEMDAADKRSPLGMKILSGLKPSEDGATLDGEIYNRENGKTYSVRLSLQGPQQLSVRPYVFLPVFGKTQLWQRSPAPTGLPSLPASAASAGAP